MTCERVRAQLTGYLDGELDSDAGTMVRGHLRTCEACRSISADEAVLRDGLRSMPTVDPPSSLWAGVQARLAVEEVAESRRPAWRRAVTRSQQSWQRVTVILFGVRWQRMLPAPRFAIAGALVAAAAVGVVYWKTRPAEEVVIVDNGNKSIPVPPQKFAPDGPKHPVVTPSSCTTVVDATDVTQDLELNAKRVDAAYDCAIQELLTEATHVRSDWSETQRSAFDDRVRTMRDAIAKATDGKPKKRAASALVSYLQGAVTRDQVLVAGLP